MRRSIPHPPLLLRTLRSSVVVWLLVRVAYVFVLMAGSATIGLFTSAEVTEFALHPTIPSRLLLLIITALLLHVDRRRAHEYILQSTLATSARWFTATSLAGAAIVDLLTQAVLDKI